MIVGGDPHLISHRRLLDPAPANGIELPFQLSPHPIPLTRPPVQTDTALKVAPAIRINS